MLYNSCNDALGCALRLACKTLCITNAPEWCIAVLRKDGHYTAKLVKIAPNDYRRTRSEREVTFLKKSDIKAAVERLVPTGNTGPVLVFMYDSYKDRYGKKLRWTLFNPATLEPILIGGQTVASSAPALVIN